MFASLLAMAVALAMPELFPNSSAAAADAKPPFGENVQFRGSLNNSRIQFERRHKGRVAFMGGSITEMNGYRPMVCDLLRKRFPGTTFKFTDAGIASTCSTTGAFRLATDVLDGEPVDLFFVEFAVNDDQDAAHTRTECIRGLEGIIRHARQVNPNMDIIITYFVNEGMLKTLHSGQIPLTIEAHQAVARHYALASINLAKEVAEEITAGTLTWQQYGGVHPVAFGNALCARMIDELFSRAWNGPLAKEATSTAPPNPAHPLDPYNYGSGHFLDPQEARVQRGWILTVPDWPHLPGSKRSRFISFPMLCATEPGAELSLKFTGTAVGAYIIAGPDAGIVEATVDGEAVQTVNLYHHFSANLHYPRTVMFGAEFNPGEHTLTLRMSNETRTAGHAMRIMQFVVN
jgi:lysophospholipase L1-like esterase